MKVIFTTIRYLLIGALILMTLLLIATLVPIKDGIRVKIVKSGSMEPTIMTGSIVVIKPEPVYSVGDIITFGKDTKTQIPTTHRIVAITGSGASGTYQTKGDANDAPDQTNTRIGDIEGKVIFHASYIGYILDFARKPLGFALIVGVPAFAIIFDEITKIFAEIRRLRREKRKNTRIAEAAAAPIEENPKPLVRKVVSSDGIMTKAPTPVPQHEKYDQPKVPKTDPYVRSIAAALVIAGSFAGIASIGGTKAYFNDMEASIGNLLKAGLVSLRLSSNEDVAGRPALMRTSDASLADSSTIPPAEEPAIGSDLFSIDLDKGDQSFPLIYTITPKFDDDAPNGCKAMTLEAWINDFHWSGLLTDFALPATTTLGHLQFLLTIPVPNTLAPHAKCAGALVFSAGIAGVPDPISHSFSDTKQYRFEIMNSEATPPSSEEGESSQSETTDTPPTPESESNTENSGNTTESASSTSVEEGEPPSAPSDTTTDTAESQDSAASDITQ